MKHLFIVNPVADKVKGRINEITGNILAFFEEYPYINHDIHITRWERDALGIIRRYAEKSDVTLRVHVMGGTGTLFEAVNGVAGLPNAHIAAYPFGRKNSFLAGFSNDISLFSSVRSQVFSKTMPVDVIKCGDFYGIVSLSAGLEADAYASAYKKENASVFSEAVKLVLKRKSFIRSYGVSLDGNNMDGNYAVIKAYNPAVFKSNDGMLYLCFLKGMSRLKLLSVMNKYTSDISRIGKYLKGRVSFLKGRKITVSHQSGEIVAFNLDGQLFYEESMTCEVLRYALDLVQPGGVKIIK